MATRSAARSAEAAWALIWKIFQADKQRRWGMIAELGLTPAQGMAIGSLDPDDPPTMSALAQNMHCDNSTLTGVVDRLEAMGYVERVPAPQDRRARCVALTPAGVAFQQRFLETMRPAPPQLSHLTAAEAAQLEHLLAVAIDRHRDGEPSRVESP